MFRATYKPSLNFCILVPYFDPLFEYYTEGSRSLSSGRTKYRPDPGGSHDRPDSLSGTRTRPEHPCDARRADGNGGGMADLLAASPMARPRT